MRSLLRDAAQPAKPLLPLDTDGAATEEHDNNNDNDDNDRELKLARACFAARDDESRLAARCREQLRDDELLAYRRRTATIRAARCAQTSDACVGMLAQCAVGVRPSGIDVPFRAELATPRTDGSAGFEVATFDNLPPVTSGADLFDVCS
jgi:hypothetical protein